MQTITNGINYPQHKVAYAPLQAAPRQHKSMAYNKGESSTDSIIMYS